MVRNDGNMLSNDGSLMVNECHMETNPPGTWFRAGPIPCQENPLKIDILKQVGGPSGASRVRFGCFFWVINCPPFFMVDGFPHRSS